MPYLMSDDGFPDHPKVEALSDCAYRLHDAGRHYAARHTTDGAIPKYRVPRLTRTYRASALRELLDSRMWHEGGEGCGTKTCIKGEAGEYDVHDYLQWNKSASWWKTKRKKDAEELQLRDIAADHHQADGQRGGEKQADRPPQRRPEHRGKDDGKG